MIQELISTSAPRCLNGNAGFGIVAQTAGMAPNVSQAVNVLSGYTHVAPPGSAGNPVVYLHATRRSGGMLRHIISRIADCGNDYSGRSNRIAHHWIVEEGDVRSLPGGPAELTAQSIFRANWNEKAAELPHKNLTAPDVSPKKCTTWERLTGDAGWGGIVAEQAEKGAPVSIIFSSEHNSDTLRTLIVEALALLPSSVRWKTTFSTYYMKSQEASGDKIQIKCFLEGSEESQFARQSPNTLVIDLRQHQGTVPVGKYVDLARGKAQPKVQPLPKVQPDTKIPATVASVPLAVPGQVPSEPGTFEIAPSAVPMPVVPKKQKPRVDYTGGKSYATLEEPSERNTEWIKYAVGLGICILIAVGAVLYQTVPSWLENRAVQRQKAEEEAAAKQKADEEAEAKRKADEEAEAKQKAVEEQKQQQATPQDEPPSGDKPPEDNDSKVGQNGESIEELRRELETIRVKKDKAQEESDRKKEELTAQIATLKKKVVELEKRKTEQSDLAERERKTADDLKNKLPSVWKGLELPSADSGKVATLPESKFLYSDHKDEIKFRFVPFVDLKSEVTDQKMTIHVDDTKLPITFSFPDEIKSTLSGGETKVPGGKIAEIDLNENGLQFKWEDDTARNATVWYQIKNRIMLSKLRISVGDNTENAHEIALREPYKYNPQSPPKSVVFGETEMFFLEIGKDSLIMFQNYQKMFSSFNVTVEGNITMGHWVKLLKNISNDGEKQTKLYLLKPETTDFGTQENKLLLMEATK